MISLVLVIVAVAAAAYGWPSQTDSAPLVALITNAKPASAETVSNDSNRVATAQADTQEVAYELPPTLSSKEITLELPAQYNTLDYSVEVSDDTRIADLSFATDIDDQYRPIGQRSLFGKGFFTLYATFEYIEMADGMEWSWVWRHNGEVIDGGNQIWAYGNDGPGYVYLSPEEGFSEGDYSLEIWLNDQLIAHDTLVVSGNAANN